VNEATLNEPTCGSSATGRRRLWLIFGLFAAYVLLQLVFRVLASDSVELDEAEQLILTQSFQWGYGNQPPLYTWLQILVFGICGTNIFALALLKSMLLFAILALTWLSVREITASERVALVATVSLFLMPQFAWEARRDLSHTVLALALIAATLFFSLRMWKRGYVRDYVGFGLSVGLGFLSKYNYPLFLVPFLLAGCTSKIFRAVILNRKTLVSLALSLGVTFAHLSWMLTHQHLLRTGANKLLVSKSSSLVGASVAGLGSLVVSTLTVTALLAGIYFVFFFRATTIHPAMDEHKEVRKLLGQTLWIGLVCCVALAACFQVRFKDRWLLPLLFIVPVYGVLLIQPRMDARRATKLLWVGGSAAVVALIALPAAAPLAPLTRKYTRLNAPYSALASQLKELGLAPSLIVAENRLIGGNLKLFFKSSAVVVPELVISPPTRQGEWLVIWEEEGQNAVTPALAEFVGKLRGDIPAEIQPHFIEAHLKYSRKKVIKLGFVVLRETP